MPRYFPHKTLSGILRFYWDNYRNEYYHFVEANASSYNKPSTKQYIPNNVIDWSSNLYWYYDSSQNGKKPLTYFRVCLLKHKIKVESYDIQTSNAHCKLSNWEIIASNYPNYWEKDVRNNNFVKTLKTLGNEEVANTIWNTRIPYSCFRVTQEESVCSTGGFDIKKMDFYGYLYTEYDMNTFENRERLSKLFFFLFVVISQNNEHKKPKKMK